MSGPWQAVDVHAHVASVDALSQMREVMPEVIPDVDRDTDASGDMIYFRYPSGVVNGPVPRGIVDVDARLADMARIGIDHQVLSVRPQMFTYDLPGEVAASLAGLANDEIVATAEAHPDAFSAMVSLPLQSAEASIAEIQRWADNRHVRGVLIDSNVAGMSYADPHFGPVWTALEAADLPVLVHPYQADVVGKERLGDHYLFNLIGNPADTTIAVSNVVFGGLLDAYPALRWGFVHGGGLAPYLVGRWDHGWGKRAVTRENIPNAMPSEYLARLWFDCLVHDPRPLRYLAELVGWDHIMLGTDYPFDMGFDAPIDFIDKVGLAQADRDQVLTGTASGFLRRR